MANDQTAGKRQTRLKMGSAGIVTTLLYLWLAVLGAGGFVAFFSHPARIILAVSSLMMAGAAFFSDVNLSSGEREDRANRWIFVPFLVIGLLSAWLSAYTERKGLWVLDGRRFAGWVRFSTLGVVRCESGRFSSLAAASAGWWPFSLGMSLSPPESIPTSGPDLSPPS